MRTPLNRLKRHGNRIKSPFSALDDTLSLSSWKDEHLLNILWAALLMEGLPREQALNCFRNLCVFFSDTFGDMPNTSPCHNFLSTITYADFEKAFAPIMDSEEAINSLRPLLFIESMPDKHHWIKLIPETDSSLAIEFLARAIFACLDHQSERSTDIRWFKVAHRMYAGRLRFPADMRERVLEIRDFPDRGDLRIVRPLIRATEMGFRAIESGDESPEGQPLFPSETVWRELFNKTQCVYPHRKPPANVNKEALAEELTEVYFGVCEHFFNIIDNTNINPRLDSVFGLTLYPLQLSFELTLSPIDMSATGRMTLRAVVESFITFTYLLKEDREALWSQYRRYGHGQTKLAFLKMLQDSEKPDYIDPDTLEILANEDIWMEMSEINLGAWSNMNIRKMAAEAGVKDMYDRYFDWTSGFVHAQWSPVRETTFTTCINPLHRLHRIPVPTQPMPTVLYDICKVTNQILENLNHAYPTYKKRIKWHKND